MPMNPSPLRHQTHSSRLVALACIAMGLVLSTVSRAQDKPKAAAAPDILLLSNGDTLHGKFVSEIGGKVTFHSEPLGDLTVSWDNIKELHTASAFAVLEKNVKIHHKKTIGEIPVGSLDVTEQGIAVHAENGKTPATIPTKDALFIVDQPTLDKQIRHEPNFFTGWNGAATAGAAIVTATQKQYTVSGSLGLVRTIPTVSWLSPRNRTSADFSGSYGKITQPAYLDAGILVPETSTKSAIYHIDAERDEFLSPRVFALAQTAFDHNYSQDLQLQQVYGGGLGVTVLKTPKQEADLKATAQYEKQEFISGAAGTNQNLVGSTFAATYLLHAKIFTLTQSLAFVPAYNTPRAYSANEVDTVAFPAYKRLSFSLGTNDSYLNDPPSSLPPTKRNSFQFTMGLTYALKSKY